MSDTDATPTERLFSAALVVAPLLYLAADATYAATSWHDATAGVLHILAATAYGFLVLGIAARLPRDSLLAMFIVLTGVFGVAGNVAYGFDTIHLSLGDAALVDQSGAANLIKPYGVLFPISMVLVAWALAKLGQRWQAGLVLVGALVFPVAHIGNIAPLAVTGEVLFVVGFAGVVWAHAPTSPSATRTSPVARRAPSAG